MKNTKERPHAAIRHTTLRWSRPLCATTDSAFAKKPAAPTATSNAEPANHRLDLMMSLRVYTGSMPLPKCAATQARLACLIVPLSVSRGRSRTAACQVDK
eukprot:2312671-Prymnesium_polylepis.3